MSPLIGLAFCLVVTNSGTKTTMLNNAPITRAMNAPWEKKLLDRGASTLVQQSVGKAISNVGARIIFIT